jgi:sulfite reductase (ferredoxin)
VPMGDLVGDALVHLADVAERFSDGTLRITRDQDVLFRDVAIERIDELRTTLRRAGVRILGEGQAPRVRACTGAAVCALGITTAPDAGLALLRSSGLGRHPSLRISVSGCPNSCAQHQAADIGLAGTKVRVGGQVGPGYQVFVGADLDRDVCGEVVGRVAVSDVVAAVDALVGTWEAVRHDGESIGRAFRRIGLDAVTAHVTSLLEQRWASGADEPDLARSPAA